MRIGINGYEAVVNRFGGRVGSSEYCFQLLWNLNKIDQNNDYYIFLPQKPPREMPAESEHWHYIVVPKKTIWTLLDLSFELLRHKYDLDVFFSPTHYLPIYCPYPSVISVMDLSYIHFPHLFKSRDLFQLKWWTKFSIAKAVRILTISQASKDDIIKEFHIDESKVKVTYLGVKS